MMEVLSATTHNSLASWLFEKKDVTRVLFVFEFEFVFVYLPHDYNNYKEMPKKM